jgi:hypothetical protein
MKNVIYFFIGFAAMTMIACMTIMFTEPKHILLATYVFILAAVLGTASLLTIPKK